jgi:DNA-binding CsgD family transcriptional regulator
VRSDESLWWTALVRGDRAVILRIAHGVDAWAFRYRLTPSQAGVLGLAATEPNASNRWIASTLGVTERTVEAHGSAVSEKTGHSSLRHAALTLLRELLVGDGGDAGPSGPDA